MLFSYQFKSTSSHFCNPSKLSENQLHSLHLFPGISSWGQLNHDGGGIYKESLYQAGGGFFQHSYLVRDGDETEGPGRSWAAGKSAMNALAGILKIKKTP